MKIVFPTSVANAPVSIFDFDVDAPYYGHRSNTCCDVGVAMRLLREREAKLKQDLQQLKKATADIQEANVRIRAWDACLTKRQQELDASTTELGKREQQLNDRQEMWDVGPKEYATAMEMAAKDQHELWEAQQIFETKCNTIYNGRVEEVQQMVSKDIEELSTTVSSQHIDLCCKLLGITHTMGWFDQNVQRMAKRLKQLSDTQRAMQQSGKQFKQEMRKEMTRHQKWRDNLGTISFDYQRMLEKIDAAKTEFDAMQQRAVEQRKTIAQLDRKIIDRQRKAKHQRRK